MSWNLLNGKPVEDNSHLTDFCKHGCYSKNNLTVHLLTVKDSLKLCLYVSSALILLKNMCSPAEYLLLAMTAAGSIAIS